MKCPMCGCLETFVINSRVEKDFSSVRRRRKCKDCDLRFNTHEITKEHLGILIGAMDRLELSEVWTDGTWDPKQ